MASVTDHAILRWLERTHGVDVEAIRKHLAVKGIDTAAAIGCGIVVLSDRSRLRLAKKGLMVLPVAVTCLEPRDPRKRRK